jgi:DNA (cytosine-5)-methyltransferase 1
MDVLSVRRPSIDRKGQPCARPERVPAWTGSTRQVLRTGTVFLKATNYGMNPRNCWGRGESTARSYICSCLTSGLWGVAGQENARPRQGEIRFTHVDNRTSCSITTRSAAAVWALSNFDHARDHAHSLVGAAALLALANLIQVSWHLPMIPVIDLFAGPGGLGEGFSAFRNTQGDPIFKIALSIEKDPVAHETLKLRSFFRQFSRRDVPEDYYGHLRGETGSEELYRLYPVQAGNASSEAWNAELGNYRRFSASAIDQRITESLNGAKDWVLIGGPPCQAYSIAGRSRVIPVDRRDGTNNYENDKRHFLYTAYLRIIAEHSPPVFVMENVKGILSAKVAGNPIIDRILSDLRHPIPAAHGEDGDMNGGLEYKIYPLADYSPRGKLFDAGSDSDPASYIVKSEDHRVPQARHRLILVGVRSDIEAEPASLRVYRKKVKMWAAISDLPRLRSRLSEVEDSGPNWVSTLRKIVEGGAMLNLAIDDKVHAVMTAKLDQLSECLPTGKAFTKWDRHPRFQHDWFYDPRLGGICNHVTRRHMSSDLWRYFFSACFATSHKNSPKLPDFPTELLPEHENIKGTAKEDIIFKDRFRVQVRSKPATTITSHIAKDGHYFIHPDPLQCRSLTVREAARLQTFPDNYFFSGPVTVQYQQVGNAVPPLLARQIAAIVNELFN